MLSQMCNLLKASPGVIPSLVEVLQRGELIALPTDTIYGLAGDASSPKAVQNLYSVKGRHLAKPLALCLASVDQVPLWAHVSSLPNGLLSALLPGPVTVVLQRKDVLYPHINPSHTKVGIRVPDYQIVRELVSCLGVPLALTSANLSNELSSLCVSEFKELWPKLGVVLDAGPLASSRAGSTVVDLTSRGYYVIVREGSALSQTTATLNKFDLVESMI